MRTTANVLILLSYARRKKYWTTDYIADMRKEMESLITLLITHCKNIQSSLKSKAEIYKNINNNKIEQNEDILQKIYAA